MASNDSRPLDHRLEDVINRYEAQISWAQDENMFPNEEIAWLAQCAMQMTTEEEPALWRVRVHVSLS